MPRALPARWTGPAARTTAGEQPLQRATARLVDHGVIVERALSDNGSAHRSHAWRDSCADLGITAQRTRTCPQTGGKIERFHRTPSDGWPTPGSAAQKTRAAQPFPTGGTSPITTARTPRSAASHRSYD